MVTSGTRVQDATDYDLLYEAHNVTSEDGAQNLERLKPLTPVTWLKLLSSDRGPENSMFHLKQKFRGRSRSRRPYNRRRSPRLSMRGGYYHRGSAVRVSTRSPPTTLIRYGNPENSDRKQGQRKDKLALWKGDQRGINTVASVERSGPAFVRNTPEHRSGSREQGEVLPGPIRHSGDLERDILVKVRRRVADAYCSDDDLPVIERKRTTVSKSVTRHHRGRSRWPIQRPSDSTSDDARAAESGTPPIDASGASTAGPFFTWCVNSDRDVVGGSRDNNTTPIAEPATQNLFRILRKIHESSLQSNVREVYSKAYTCTEESLLERHRELAKEMFPGAPTEAAKSSISPSGHGKGTDQHKGTDLKMKEASRDAYDAQPPAAPQLNSALRSDTDRNNGTARQQEDGSPDMENPQDPATPPVGAPDQHPPGGSTSVQVVNPADVLGKQLLELSQTLIRRFVPKDEHSVYHPVCARFWGSVDVAIRVSTRRLAPLPMQRSEIRNPQSRVLTLTTANSMVHRTTGRVVDNPRLRFRGNGQGAVCRMHRLFPNHEIFVRIRGTPAPPRRALRVFLRGVGRSWSTGPAA